MRILLFFMMLVLTSTYASAASVGITNIYSSTSNVTPTSGIQNGLVIADSFVLQTPVDNFQAFSVGFDLEFNSESLFGFDLRLNNTMPWSVSVISLNNSFSTTLSSTGTSSVSFSPNLVNAGEVYRILIEGTARLSGPSSGPRFLSVTMENIQVSEVPLPAAFWLFGTALMGGLAFRRNRMKKLSAQAA